MDSEDDNVGLIDLGSASLQTKGWVSGKDDHGGLIPFEGLNDE